MPTSPGQVDIFLSKLYGIEDTINYAVQYLKYENTVMIFIGELWYDNIIVSYGFVKTTVDFFFLVEGKRI